MKKKISFDEYSRRLLIRDQYKMRQKIDEDLLQIISRIKPLVNKEDSMTNENAAGRFLNIKEAAKILNVNVSTIYSWIRYKHIHATHLNGELVLNEKTVLDLAELRKSDIMRKKERLAPLSAALADKQKPSLEQWAAEHRIFPTVETAAEFSKDHLTPLVLPKITNSQKKIARLAQKLYSENEKEAALILSMSIINDISV